MVHRLYRNSHTLLLYPLRLDRFQCNYSLTVFGWSRPQFVGVGRKKPYSIEIQVKKGYYQLLNRRMRYDVVLAESGNASEKKALPIRDIMQWCSKARA